ncbi:hypothetical protein [Microvirga roseola]|uniref:hypothetical protein n=1 Tax=Microvirga roseola TaxID=2883126 RepID=UPI001E2F7AC9|nr:hypothetical protein [Microvirga roseola]
MNPAHSRKWARRSGDLLLAAVVITACGVLNRVAGGGLPYVTELPGRAMIYASFAVFLVSILSLSWWRWPTWRIPLWIAVSYAIWRTFEWGMVFDLGNLPDEEPRSPFGRLFFITGDDYADLWIRMVVGLLPGAVLSLWLLRHGLLRARLRTLLVIWLGLGTAIWLAYVAAWELQEIFPVPLAELITGAVWGLAIVSAPNLRPKPLAPLRSD